MSASVSSTSSRLPGPSRAGEVVAAGAEVVPEAPGNAGELALDLPVQAESVIAEQLRDDPVLEPDLDGVLAGGALDGRIDHGTARTGTHRAAQQMHVENSAGVASPVCALKPLSVTTAPIRLSTAP
jgi:hypothetical protein